MKRSEINQLQKEACAFFAQHQFHLPVWATWSTSEWEANKGRAQEVIETKLGWDLTDFGSGDFYKQGLLLFTIRNGRHNSQDKNRKEYAEKIMIVREGQVTPWHFHWHKMEDIINRGGGNLVIELNASTTDEKFSDEDFFVHIDGLRHQLKAGEKVILKPGDSITLPTGLYHNFYGEEGSGQVLVGEVSSVNDDANDNRFYEDKGRFPEIEEDEEPLYLLCNEYPSIT